MHWCTESMINCLMLLNHSRGTQWKKRSCTHLTLSIIEAYSNWRNWCQQSWQAMEGGLSNEDGYSTHLLRERQIIPTVSSLAHGQQNWTTVWTTVFIHLERYCIYTSVYLWRTELLDNPGHEILWFRVQWRKQNFLLISSDFKPTVILWHLTLGCSTKRYNIP